MERWAWFRQRRPGLVFAMVTGSIVSVTLGTWPMIRSELRSRAFYQHMPEGLFLVTTVDGSIARRLIVEAGEIGPARVHELIDRAELRDGAGMRWEVRIASDGEWVALFSRGVNSRVQCVLLDVELDHGGRGAVVSRDACVLVERPEAIRLLRSSTEPTFEELAAIARYPRPSLEELIRSADDRD